MTRRNRFPSSATVRQRRTPARLARTRAPGMTRWAEGARRARMRADVFRRNPATVRRAGSASPPGGPHGGRVSAKTRDRRKGAPRPKRKPSHAGSRKRGTVGGPGGSAPRVIRRNDGAGEGRSPSRPKKWRTPAPGGGTRGSEGISTGADRGCVSCLDCCTRTGVLGRLPKEILKLPMDGNPVVASCW